MKTGKIFCLNLENRSNASFVKTNDYWKKFSGKRRRRQKCGGRRWFSSCTSALLHWEAGTCLTRQQTAARRRSEIVLKFHSFEFDAYCRREWWPL